MPDRGDATTPATMRLFPSEHVQDGAEDTLAHVGEVIVVAQRAHAVGHAHDNACALQAAQTRSQKPACDAGRRHQATKGPFAAHHGKHERQRPAVTDRVGGLPHGDQRRVDRNWVDCCVSRTGHQPCGLDVAQRHGRLVIGFQRSNRPDLQRFGGRRQRLAHR